MPNDFWKTAESDKATGFFLTVGQRLRYDACTDCQAYCRKVVAKCSAANVEMSNQLGVDDIADYVAQKILENYLQKVYSERIFDRITNTVGIPAR